MCSSSSLHVLPPVASRAVPAAPGAGGAPTPAQVLFAGTPERGGDKKFEAKAVPPWIDTQALREATRGGIESVMLAKLSDQRTKTLELSQGLELLCYSAKIVVLFIAGPMSRMSGGQITGPG